MTNAASTQFVVNRDQNLSTFNSAVDEEIIFSDNNNKFEEIEMSFADNATDFILDLLTDLSANRGAYALREAYSNAYDATVAAGDLSLPIEITLPTYIIDKENTLVSRLGYCEDASSSVCVVKDHGCGMTEDDVRKYFTQYGGSKKRNTEDIDLIGSKGLGSKAPLACSDTFTVITTKDGITTTAILERRNGRNYASITSETTNHANGTEIRIPITDENIAKQMIDCADNITRYNMGANVIIDGNKSETRFTETADINKEYSFFGNVTIGQDSNGNPVSVRVWRKTDRFNYAVNSGSDVVYVLGGYGYEYKNKKSGFLRYNANLQEFIIEGLPGFLNFTPSRDEIKDDKYADNFFEAFFTAVSTELNPVYVEQLLASMTKDQRFNWISSYNCTHNDDGSITFTNNSLNYGKGTMKFTLPNADLFTTDNGFDMSTLLDVDHVEEANGNIFVARYTDKHFAVLEKSRNAYRPNFYKIGKKDFNFETDMFMRRINKNTTDDENENENNSSVSFNLDYLLKCFKDNSTKHALIISGIDSAHKMSDFSNREKQVRDALNIPSDGKKNYEEIHYIFSINQDLTDDDKQKLEFIYPNLTSWTYEEMMDKAKQNRKTTCANNKSNGVTKKVTPENKNDKLVGIGAYVFDLTNPFELAYGYVSAYDARSNNREFLDLSDTKNYDDAVFYLYTNYVSSHIVELAHLLKGMKELDENVNRLICIDVKAEIARYLNDNGMKVFFDGRTTVRTPFKSIVSKNDAITLNSSSYCDKSRNTITTISYKYLSEKMKNLDINTAKKIAATNSNSVRYYMSRIVSATNIMGEKTLAEFADGKYVDLVKTANDYYDNRCKTLFNVAGMPEDGFKEYFTDFAELSAILVNVFNKVDGLDNLYRVSEDVQDLMRAGLIEKLNEAFAEYNENINTPLDKVA